MVPWVSPCSTRSAHIHCRRSSTLLATESIQKCKRQLHLPTAVVGGDVSEHGKHRAQSKGAAEEHLWAEPLGQETRGNLCDDVAPEEAAQQHRLHLFVPFESLRKRRELFTNLSRPKQKHRTTSKLSLVVGSVMATMPTDRLVRRALQKNSSRNRRMVC